MFIPAILLTVLSDLYIDKRLLRRLPSYNKWKRLLWWTPCALIIIFAVYFTMQPDYVPVNPSPLYVYLFIVGIIVVPKAVFAVCSLVGQVLRSVTHSRRNLGHVVAPVFWAIALYIIIYGSTAGVRKLVVKHVDIYSNDLPVAFDGYRIVQFSDAHVGSLTGSRKSILVRVVDSINAQHADIVAFTGDIQDARPAELCPFMGIFSRVKAKDGVYSILGNHDYSYYIKVDKATAAANKKELVSLEQRCGWTVLLNDNKAVRRGNDSIIIAGEEDSGQPPFPDYGDLGKTLARVSPQAYVVLLQHDPSTWDRSILPKSRAQLTLSGHTHGGQVSLFGIRPTLFKYKEDDGLYYDGKRALYVSSGIGGLVPFRFAVPAEIVVITLRKSK